MINVIPKLRLKYGENLGIELFIEHPTLDGNLTFLNADIALGVTSLPVDNGLKFASGEYVVVGNLKSEKTEVSLNSGAPTSTALTVGATTFSHSRGESIQFTPVNQLVIESSSDGITYSVLATIDIRFDSDETYYNHVAGTSSTYYRIRFKNEADVVYSQYSDPFIGTGFAYNSAGKIIRSALVLLGEEIDEKIITKEFLYEALDEGRNEIDQHKDIFRWPFRTVFDYNAGTIIPGEYKLAVPTDLRNQDTNENILTIRIGKKKYSVRYLDKIAFNTYYQDVAHTTLDGALVTADTTITLTSSGDFNESGGISIAGQAVNEEIDAVDYTANDETTNVISGVTGIRASGHADGTDVWQNANFGVPQFFTVDNGYILFNSPFDNNLDGENIWIDYYKAITRIDSDGDLFDEPFYNIYIPWLKWKIKSKKNPKLKMTNDSDYLSWIEKREAQVQKSYLGTDMRINVNLPNTDTFNIR